MVENILLICPFSLKLSNKGKSYAINLNKYKLWHYLTSSKLKKKYKDEMRLQLEGVKIKTPVEVIYKVYKPTRRKLDKQNVTSITAKFLMDAITEFGCWDDDNDDIIKTETILPTEHDASCPRVEVEIKSIN